MAVKIKLMRLGKMRAPYYRIVVADARTKRDGRAIETIGKYHPKEDPSFIEVDGERAAYWLSVGAQPTEAVTAILKVTGDWQKFKGLPAPPPMMVAAAQGRQEGRLRGGRQGALRTSPRPAPPRRRRRRPRRLSRPPRPTRPLPRQAEAPAGAGRRGPRCRAGRGSCAGRRGAEPAEAAEPTEA